MVDRDVQHTLRPTILASPLISVQNHLATSRMTNSQVNKLASEAANIQPEKKPPKSDPLTEISPLPSPTSPAIGSFYESESQYNLRFSYSNYDLYRSVLEITLNVSFLAATSNQLRLLISFRESQDFIASTALVTASLLLQILIAVNVVTIAVNDQFRWIKLKAFTSIGAILLTVVNVLIPWCINVEHSNVNFTAIYSH